MKRDRWLVAVVLFGLTVLAWGYLVHEARDLSLSGVCHCAGMKMSGPDLQPWSAAVLPPLFLMWVEMMVAMMLPSAAPMVLTFAMINRQRRQQELPYVSTAIFTVGYLTAWIGFSSLAAVAQWILHSVALLSPMMLIGSSWLAGGLLVAAGVFQWTPLKQVCLRRCRSPLTLLLNEWREGRKGALMMGVRNGAYCTGCCWLLMTLLFVTGVMNLWWVGFFTLFVLAEKLLPLTWRVGALSGALLVLWGLLVSVRLLPPNG